MNRLRSYLTLAVLIYFSTLIYSQDTDSLIIKTYFANAYQSYNENDFEKCREYCLKAIDIDSTIGEAYILIGSIRNTIVVLLQFEIIAEC
jgi:hypothetical protein